MLTKQIKSRLARTHKNWAKSIDDKNVRELVEKNCFISGGAIVSLLGNEEPNDYDIYFKDFETCKAVASYYVDRWNKHHDTYASVDLPALEKQRVKVMIRSKGIAEDTEGMSQDEINRRGLGLQPKDEKKKPKDEKKFRPVFLSSNAITLSDGVQLIMRFHGSPEEVHQNFDFVHCQAYWEPNGVAYWTGGSLLNTGKLTLPAETLTSIMTKELRYSGSKYPIASILRMRKFIARGYTINAGQVLKMIFQVNKLDLNDPLVLEDQLTGVDLTYMNMLIDTVHSKRLEDPTFNFDSNWLITVVEKIFDNENEEDAENQMNTPREDDEDGEYNEQ
ncbi:nucleotidyl transferase [Bacillus phage Nachito]|nr:nucleotidyl transferase [Bacillus phage Nachito]